VSRHPRQSPALHSFLSSIHTITVKMHHYILVLVLPCTVCGTRSFSVCTTVLRHGMALLDDLRAKDGDGLESSVHCVVTNISMVARARVSFQAAKSEGQANGVS
jgi:hypothetical protein